MRENRKVKIRNRRTCKLETEVCKKGFGVDLANHKKVLKVEAIGLVPAQSI